MQVLAYSWQPRADHYPLIIARDDVVLKGGGGERKLASACGKVNGKCGAGKPRKLMRKLPPEGKGFGERHAEVPGARR